MEWAPVPRRILDIPRTLASGQSFRWRTTADGDWVGVIGDTAVRLRPGEDGFAWQTLPEPGRWDLLHRCFALDVDLESLQVRWEKAEPRIAGILRRHPGLRVLRQDAEEVFFSFVCASCNTVAKITRSVRALEQRYGEPLAVVSGEPLYRFPAAWRIAEAREADLRDDLWGFRAPRLIDLARHVASQPCGWLGSLRHAPYPVAREALTGLFGIGPKLADCVCLFGLWHDEAVPVDVHVHRAAVRLLRPDLEARSLTSAVYGQIAQAFRDRFGCHAGWVQQHLFLEAIEQGRARPTAGAGNRTGCSSTTR